MKGSARDLPTSGKNAVPSSGVRAEVFDILFICFAQMCFDAWNPFDADEATIKAGFVPTYQHPQPFAVCTYNITLRFQSSTRTFGWKPYAWRLNEIQWFLVGRAWSPVLAGRAAVLWLSVVLRIRHVCVYYAPFKSLLETTIVFAIRDAFGWNANSILDACISSRTVAHNHSTTINIALVLAHMCARSQAPPDVSVCGALDVPSSERFAPKSHAYLIMCST